MFIRSGQVAIHRNRRREIAAISQRGHARPGGRLDAALRPDPIDQLVLERLRARLIIASPQQVYRGCKDAFSRKSRAGVAYADKTADEKSGAHKQYEAERYLN